MPILLLVPTSSSFWIHWSFLINATLSLLQGSPLLSENRRVYSWPSRSSYVLSLEVLWSYWWIPKFGVPSPPRSQGTSKHSWPNWQCHSSAPWAFLRHSLHCDGCEYSDLPLAGLGDRELFGQKGVSILLQQWADPTGKGESAVTWEKVRVVIWLKTPERRF